MNKTPNWSEIYDEYLEKIEQAYIEQLMLMMHNTSFLPNTGKAETKEKYICDTKHIFLRSLNKGYIASAFRKLQKRIPILAEKIIIECYDKKYLNKAIFSEIFRDVYVYEKKEKTIFTYDIDNDRLIEIFKYCNPNILMNKEELNYLKNISSTFTIYRGVAGRSFDEAINGISWTTNIKTAKEFAINNKKIYNTKNALIIEGCIKKQDIIAYFNVSGRYENEVIAEPSTILNTKIIK